MAFTGMRTGSLTLSTLSRPTGHLGSGHSAGSPGGVAHGVGTSGWGPPSDLGRSMGALQQSQSVPATPTMLMGSVARAAGGAPFEDAAAARDSHSASAPVLPNAASGSPAGQQTQQASPSDGASSPEAPAMAPAREAEPAAGQSGAHADTEPQDRHEQPSSDAAAEVHHPSDGATAKQHHRRSATDGGSGGVSAQQQLRAPGMRKNKFSSFSSDVPPDRHWPPGAPSSGVSESTTPVDASPALVLRPEQQVCLPSLCHNAPDMSCGGPDCDAVTLIVASTCPQSGALMVVAFMLQQQAAVLARGARRHDSRKSEVSAVAEDLLNASHAHKYASGGKPLQSAGDLCDARYIESQLGVAANVQKLAGCFGMLRSSALQAVCGSMLTFS